MYAPYQLLEERKIFRACIKIRPLATFEEERL